MIRVALMALAVLAGGCREKPRKPSAAQELEALERRLLAAGDVEIKATITAEGAHQARVRGWIRVQGADKVRLEYNGTFDGKTWPAFYDSGGASPPEGVREAVLLGVTRMGILHNVAVVGAGREPDTKGGKFRQAVQVSDVVAQDGRVDDQPARVFHFKVHVDGKHRADAKLFVDRASGLPRSREQTVRFDEGDMKVVERYEAFAVR